MRAAIKSFLSLGSASACPIHQTGAGVTVPFLSPCSCLSSLSHPCLLSLIISSSCPTRHQRFERRASLPNSSPLPSLERSCALSTLLTHSLRDNQTGRFCKALAPLLTRRFERSLSLALPPPPFFASRVFRNQRRFPSFVGPDDRSLLLAPAAWGIDRERERWSSEEKIPDVPTSARAGRTFEESASGDSTARRPLENVAPAITPCP